MVMFQKDLCTHRYEFFVQKFTVNTIVIVDSTFTVLVCILSCSGDCAIWLACLVATSRP